MNKKIKKLVLLGLLSISMITSMTINCNAVDKNNVLDLKSGSIEIRNSDGELIDVDNLIVESEIVDIEIENSDVLIKEGLLSKNYKSEMLDNMNSRLKKNITIWFDYPTKITEQIKLKNPYESNKLITTYTLVGTFQANVSKQLKSSIAAKNKKDSNGYITRWAPAIQGKYVNKGGTSKSTKVLSATKPGYTIKNRTSYFSAKYVRYIPVQTTQVGFGIEADVSYQ